MKHRRHPWWLTLAELYQTMMIVYLVLRLLVGSRWWWLNFLHTFALWLFVPALAVIIIAIGTRRTRLLVVSGALLLIGLLQFAPLPIGLLTASDAQHDLRVLTYNVLGPNQEIEEAIDWVLAQNADVIVLQELVEHNRAAQLPRLLAQYPYHVNVSENVRVLSRLPLIEGDTIWLEDPSGARDGRLAVRAVVNLDGQPITIYGVHLSVPTRDRQRWQLETGIDTLDFILRYDETFRNTQLRNLADRTRAEDHPMIIAGDFNTSHTSPILDALERAGLTDAFRAVGTGWGMTWSHDPPTLPLLRIDYIWSSARLQPLRYQRGDFYGSDHRPLVVDFALR